MASVYKVTRTVTNTPAVEVSASGSITYNELIMSLGPFVFKAKKMYIQANSTMQVSKVIVLNEYDANGNIRKFPVTPNVDPYQMQPALSVDLNDRNVIFDGRLTFNFTLNPLEQVILIFDVIELSAKNFAPGYDDDFEFFSSFRPANE